MAARIDWTPEQDRRLRALAGSRRVSEIAQILGCSPNAARGRATKIGLSLKRDRLVGDFDDREPHAPTSCPGATRIGVRAVALARAERGGEAVDLLARAAEMLPDAFSAAARNLLHLADLIAAPESRATDGRLADFGRGAR